MNSVFAIPFSCAFAFASSMAEKPDSIPMHELRLPGKRQGEVADAAVEVQHGLACRVSDAKSSTVLTMFRFCSQFTWKKLPSVAFSVRPFHLQRQLVPAEGEDLFPARKPGDADHVRVPSA